MYMSRKYRKYYFTRSWYPVGKGFTGHLLPQPDIYYHSILSSSCCAHCWTNKHALRHLHLLVQATLQPHKIIFKPLSDAPSQSVPIGWSMPLLSSHPTSVRFTSSFPSHCWIVWYVLNKWYLTESDVWGGGRSPAWSHSTLNTFWRPASYTGSTWAHQEKYSGFAHTVSTGKLLLPGICHLS